MEGKKRIEKQEKALERKKDGKKELVVEDKRYTKRAGYSFGEGSKIRSKGGTGLERASQEGEKRFSRGLREKKGRK